MCRSHRELFSRAEIKNDAEGQTWECCCRQKNHVNPSFKHLNEINPKAKIGKSNICNKYVSLVKKDNLTLFVNFFYHLPSYLVNLLYIVLHVVTIVVIVPPRGRPVELLHQRVRQSGLNSLLSLFMLSITVCHLRLTLQSLKREKKY